MDFFFIVPNCHASKIYIDINESFKFEVTLVEKSMGFLQPRLMNKDMIMIFLDFVFMFMQIVLEGDEISCLGILLNTK